MSKGLHILMSILILQQGFAFSLLSNSTAHAQRGEAFESCLIEILEWVSGEDIDLPCTDEGLPDPQESSEEDRAETEKSEDKTFMKQGIFVAATIPTTGFGEHQLPISVAFHPIFTPPPEFC